MNDKTFLSRWSQRKTAQQQRPSAEPLINPTAEPIAEQTEPHNPPAVSPGDQEIEPVEQPPLTDEDMPTIESLEENSDFSQFFSSGVSEELRNLALRKLFNLPQFNIRDGLNDYDEDFSKLPALSQEVVAKMRSWLQDGQEQVSTEISEHMNQTAPEEQPESVPTTDEIETEDELGDADLEG